MTSRCAAVKIVLMKIWKKDPWLVSIDRNTFHKKEKIENEKVQNSFEQQKYQIIFKNGLSNYFFQCKAATSTDVLKQIPEGPSFGHSIRWWSIEFEGRQGLFFSKFQSCSCVISPTKELNNCKHYDLQFPGWLATDCKVVFATKIRLSFMPYFSAVWLNKLVKKFAELGWLQMMAK